MDEFVQGVLETKAALVSAVIEGEALDPAATRDVLAELERLVGNMSARLADPDTPLTDEEWAEALIKEVEAEQATQSGNKPSQKTERPSLSREALLALARVLNRPGSRIYRASSKSDPGKGYTVSNIEACARTPEHLKPSWVKGALSRLVMRKYENIRNRSGQIMIRLCNLRSLRNITPHPPCPANNLNEH